MKTGCYRIVLLITSLNLLLSGCQFKDMDKRSFVTTMGIDHIPNRPDDVHITMKIGIPSAKRSPGEAKFITTSHDGPTIGEAIKSIQSLFDQELDFSHLALIVMGEAYIQQDFTQAIDWLTRRYEIQQTSLFAAGSPDAKTVLNVKNASEQVYGNALTLHFQKYGISESETIGITKSEFFNRWKEKGKDPFLPIIHVTDQKYDINQIALLHKSKSIGKLSPHEVQLLKMLMKSGNLFSFRVREPQNAFVVKISDSTCKQSITRTANGIVITIHMKVTGSVSERKKASLALSKADMEKEASAELQHRMEKLLKHLQQTDSDPAGFGLRYRATYRDGDAAEWAYWVRHYPKATFDVVTEVHLTESSVIKI
ncbi:hypothetical protein BVG16_05990 [Paenibacillus selenitireducens]|uniref:Uncharacterized protein n=1 Tax=Paenibacillus selenitireducens TaxID=1324314 RepID=A0A1T2XKS7_9BACL|nr:Ger(x)C family spore germination protein [Paenibacillus selenitireducens]OPA80283.1 hypothetical protein BVG16_05990 [Paenibacillus selenitireducens]